MKGYVGYWEDRLSFSPSVEDERTFESVGPLFLIIEEGDRRVLMLPDVEGNRSHEIERDRHAGLGAQYTWTGVSQPWARWRRHETEVYMMDDAFAFDVGPDHTLPWPKLYKTDRFDHAAVALREFRLRALSAWFAGGDMEFKRTLRSVPSKVKRLIRTQVWTSIINEIRQETPTWT